MLLVTPKEIMIKIKTRVEKKLEIDKEMLIEIKIET